MHQRHSVRQYEDRKIEANKRNLLCKEIAQINQESGLNVQILFDEPKCFDSMMAHYGKFTGVSNYIALGYGKTQGVAHTVKSLDAVTKTDVSTPDWFRKGMEAGILKVRKEGTKNFYYFDSELNSMKRLIHALQTAVDIASVLPDSAKLRLAAISCFHLQKSLYTATSHAFHCGICIKCNMICVNYIFKLP